jgi:hypothetical protein
LHHDARFIKRPGSVERAQKGFAHLIDTRRNELVQSSVKSSTKKHPKAAPKSLA